jgi:hypothetical protein
MSIFAENSEETINKTFREFDEKALEDHIVEKYIKPLIEATRNDIKHIKIDLQELRAKVDRCELQLKNNTLWRLESVENEIYNIKSTLNL